MSDRASSRTVLHRSPMVPVALAMAGGIVAGRFGSLTAAAWAIWGAVFLTAAAACLLGKFRAAAAAGVGAAIFSFGAVHVRLGYFRLPADHVVTYTTHRRTMATIRGRVAGSPSVYRRAARMDYPREPTTLFDVAAEGIRAADGWRPVTGLVQVAVQQAAPHVARGRRVELVGWISRLRPPSNPGQRDRVAAARRMGKLVDFRVPAAKGVKVLSAESGGWYGRLPDRASIWAREHLTGSVPGRAGLLLEALILGRRDPSLRPLKEAMVRAGIAHLLSISGMHLGMFLGFVYLLCRLAMLSPRRSAVAALVCLSGYLLLAEPRSPLLRSAVMAGVFCAGVILHRRNAALNALAVAMVILLAADPLALLAPGFQLSFTVVAGLIVLMPYLQELLFGRWLRERGLMVFRDDQRVRRWLHHTAANWGMGAVTMSLLAWAMSAPLLACHFGIFSPYGAVLTLLAAPLVVAAIVPGYLSLALGWAAPNLSRALASAAGLCAEALARTVEAFDRLPGLYFETQPVGPLWVAGCYAAIVLVVLHRHLPRGRAVAVAAVACLLAGTAWTQWPAPTPDAAVLDVLSVGAGQCAVLRTASGRTCLFDAGSLGRENCGEEILVRFIRHCKLPPPELAIISHANTDHYNALPAALRRGWVGKVYLSEYFGRDANAPGAPVAAELMREFTRHDAEAVRIRPGQTLRLDDRTTVEVLWPPPGRTDLTTNETSLVLRVTCDGTSLLLTGDIEEIGQAAVAAMGPAARADVLIMPHHGSWEPTLPAFFEAVSPKVVVVSTAKKLTAPLRGGDAARHFYERLGADYRLYSTLRHGWVQIRLDPRGVTVKTMRD